MRIAEVVGHFPFLRGAAIGRIEAAANSGGSPNGVAAPDIGTVARRNKKGGAPGAVGPKVVGLRAGIIVKPDIGAESGLDGRGLAGIPVVVDTDESVAAAFDDQQVGGLPADEISAILEIQFLMAPD